MTTRWLRAFLPLLLILSGSFLTANAADTPNPDEAEVAAAIRALTDAGVKTDAESLLDFFRQRTLSEADRARLSQLIQLLGDRSFAAREKASKDLLAMGRPALPVLRGALKDPDIEIAIRAEHCLEEIESGSGNVLASAALRVLGSKKPAGAVEVVLAYLPFADDAHVEEEALAALQSLGIAGGKADAAFVTAASDSEAIRRSAAAHVLSRATDREQRELARKLLIDKVASVRFTAAIGLYESNDKAAIPVLIRFLDPAFSDNYQYQAEAMLLALSGDKRPDTVAESSTDAATALTPARRRELWDAWWKSNETSIDLAKVQREVRTLGHTVIADLDNGRIVEFNAARKEVAHFDGFRGPVDAQILPNGNVLVAENHASQVTERDRTGKIIWQYATQGLPGSCQRLPNGNTFIVTQAQIVEVTPAKKEVFKWEKNEGVYAGRKLRNGQIILLNGAGKVSYLDSTGAEKRSFTINGAVVAWSSFDLLANGNLIVCRGDGKVVEYDSNGKEVWSCNVPHAVSVCRLQSGTTQVCDSEGRCVVEMDRNGKEIAANKITLPGRPWHVYRR